MSNPSTPTASLVSSSSSSVAGPTTSATDDALLSLYRRCNQAAISIKQGQYDVAMGMLEILLSEYRANLQQHGGGTATTATATTATATTAATTTATTDATNENVVGNLDTPLLSCYFLSSSSQDDDVMKEDNETEAFTNKMFMNPIYIGFSEGGGAPPNCQIVISYVLLYNLALCHHLKATTTMTSNTSSSCLNKAIRLYEIAYILFRNNDDEENLSFRMLLRQPIEYHVMVLLCNMGHINHALGNKQEQLQCYDILASAMFHIIVNDHQYRHHHHHHDEDEHPQVVVRAPSSPLQKSTTINEMMDQLFYTIMPFISKAPSAPAA